MRFLNKAIIALYYEPVKAELRKAALDEACYNAVTGTGLKYRTRCSRRSTDTMQKSPRLISGSRGFCSLAMYAVRG